MANNTGRILEKKSFVVITGASKGLGKGIASKFVSRFPPSSLFVLLSLDNTGQESLAMDLVTSFPGVQIRAQKFDQGCLEKNGRIFIDILETENLPTNTFEQAVIVHNCATVGDVSKFSWDITDVTSLKYFFDVNVTGMIFLNATFLKTFTETESRLIVNITSGNSIRPYPTMGPYCSAKAARDMYFRVMASEDPSIRILTYSPGHVDTDMLTSVRDQTADPELADKIKEAYRQGKVVPPETSAEKLVAILEKNSFENAAYVAYTDPL